MQFISLPSGAIINLDAVATIQPVPVLNKDDEDSKTFEGALLISYFSLMSSRDINGYGLQNVFRRNDAEALISALDAVGVLTGHLREGMKRVAEQENAQRQ